MHQQFWESTHSATEGAEQLSLVWQTKTKRQLQLFWPKEKPRKKRGKSGFWKNKGADGQCVTGPVFASKGFHFSEVKKKQNPNQETTRLDNCFMCQRWSPSRLWMIKHELSKCDTHSLRRKMSVFSCFTSLPADLQLVAGICFKERYLSLPLSMAKTSQRNTATFKTHSLS